jgi:hypothetical protein
MVEHLATTSTPFELHYSTSSGARAAFWDRIRRSPFSNRTCFYFDDAPGSVKIGAKFRADEVSYLNRLSLTAN